MSIPFTVDAPALSRKSLRNAILYSAHQRGLSIECNEDKRLLRSRFYFIVDGDDALDFLADVDRAIDQRNARRVL